MILHPYLYSYTIDEYNIYMLSAFKEAELLNSTTRKNHLIPYF